MTTAAAANVLTIHDKLITLLNEKASVKGAVTFKTLLQGAGPRDLGWDPADQQAFLDGPIFEVFRVRIDRKELRCSINGSALAVGDLVIAIFRAIHKQQRPRRRSLQVNG